MIFISRGPEPACLHTVRNRQLAALRKLGRTPKSDEIDGYRVIADAIWKAQHSKCCYCELRIPKSFNDVEHYRPKGFADRKPGCSLTHGYWWLAFTWNNLLFSCPGCNRSSKKAQFPLEVGSTSLTAENVVPGDENPLLIDPSSHINPVAHIEFVFTTIGITGNIAQWWARPRNKSKFGLRTITVCSLNKDELLELRNKHVDSVVQDYVSALIGALASGDIADIRREFLRAKALLRPANAHVALSYDALRHYVPDATLMAILHEQWPTPNEVAIPP